MVFDQSPRENRPGMEQFPCSEMFIMVFRPVYDNSASSRENGKWHLELDHVYKLLVSRIFNYRIDVKFPCFK